MAIFEAALTHIRSARRNRVSTLTMTTDTSH